MDERHTALDSVAAYGSVSYGELPAARLHAVLESAEPSKGDVARVYQVLSETPL
jgi:hypothetical protein